jgi:hypothetical protein
MAGARQPRPPRSSGATPPAIVPGQPCPVARDAMRLANLSHETVSALRRLRRDLLACTDCPMDETCQIRSGFNTIVQAALTEVMEEWSQERANEARAAGE